MSQFDEFREDPKVPETEKRVSGRKAAKLELDRSTALFEGCKDQLKIVFAVIERKRDSIFHDALAAYMHSENLFSKHSSAVLEQHMTTATATATVPAPHASPSPVAAAAARSVRLLFRARPKCTLMS